MVKEWVNVKRFKLKLSTGQTRCQGCILCFRTGLDDLTSSKNMVCWWMEQTHIVEEFVSKTCTTCPFGRGIS